MRVTWLCAVLALGCGASTGTSDDGAVAPICTPGEQVSCACFDGPGVQVCLDDGSGFDSCECQSSGAGGDPSTGGQSSTGGTPADGGAESGGSGGDPVSTGGDGSGGEVATGGSSSGGASTGGSSSGGATGGEPSTGGAASDSMTLPSKLMDYGECWQDAFPNPVCKPMPDLDPPILEWSCDDDVAAIRVPPQSCMKVTGRFSTSLVLTDACDAATKGCTDYAPSCTKVTNSGNDDLVRYLHRPKSCAQPWTAWWYPLAECGDVSCN